MEGVGVWWSEGGAPVYGKVVVVTVVVVCRGESREVGEWRTWKGWHLDGDCLVVVANAGPGSWDYMVWGLGV